MINLAKTFFRSMLVDSDLDENSPFGVVEDFDWPTHREAKQWLDSHLTGLNIWRRFQQTELQTKALQDVAELEYNYASMSNPRPVGRFSITGSDLGRQLTLSTIWTRLFQDLRDVEARYDARRDMALEQYEALVAHLDSLEVR